MNATVSFLDIICSQGSSRLKAIKVCDHIFGGFMARLLPSARPARVNPAIIKRILIIRPGGIGDAVFLMPILRALKDQGYCFDILCEKRNAEVFISQEGLCSEVWRYDVFSEFRRIFFKSYDAVVDTEQWHFSSALVATFARTEIRVGFATRKLRVKLFNIPVKYDLDIYELDNFRELFSFLGITSELTLEGSYEVAAISRASERTSFSGEYTALALGGSIRSRRFTLEEVMRIVAEISTRGEKVVLLGGKEVVSLGRDIGRAGIPGVFNRTEQLTIAEAGATIQGARLFIGHDSGLLHLACAVGTPVRAVFTTGNVNKWGPRGDKHFVLKAGDFRGWRTLFGYTLIDRAERDSYL